jgi:hypothetical protein
MKNNPLSRLLRGLAASRATKHKRTIWFVHRAVWLSVALHAAALTAIVSSAANSQVLLPHSDFTPAAKGIDVLVDPFPTDPEQPRLFVTGMTGGTTIFRVTGHDSSFSYFVPEPLDSAISSVFQIMHAPGEGFYAVGGSPWQVRRSPEEARGDAGTWHEDDRFFFTSVDRKGNTIQHSSKATGSAVDAMGTIYVSGMAQKGSSYLWIVRRKWTDETWEAGRTWETVHEVANPNVNMLPRVFSFPGNDKNPHPAVFTISDLNGKWTVLRSQAEGNKDSWLLVDSGPAPTAEATPYDGVVDTQGNIYVAGCRGLNGKNPSSWTVRRSDDGGNTWTTMLDIHGEGSWASRLAVDATGAVSLAGTVNPTKVTSKRGSTAGTPLWKIVRCATPNDPTAWLTAFNSGVIPFGNTNSKGRGIAADAGGNLYSSGSVIDWIDTASEPSVTFPGEHLGLIRVEP